MTMSFYMLRVGSIVVHNGVAGTWFKLPSVLGGKHLLTYVTNWGKAGLVDRLDRRRLIRLLKEQTQSGDGI